jgi:alpha-beta hydrolase superfamily lysophospholipase
VLLRHGFPEFWWTWRHQLAALPGAGFRAVAVDLRGYGGSDKPPRGYDLVTGAADAAGLIRALGKANAVVVGHALGGLIAWTPAGSLILARPDHAGRVHGGGHANGAKRVMVRQYIGRGDHSLPTTRWSKG